MKRKITKYNSLEERIHLQTDIHAENECWNWTGHKDKNGYGVLRVNTTYKRATRVIWKLNFGEIPNGMYVCHHCDNPSCVNPRHLFLGTPQDNHDDMDRKGRRKIMYGNDNPMTKLTDQNLIDIVEMWNTGKYSQQEIGEQFGVRQRTISRIVRGEERVILK